MDVISQFVGVVYLALAAITWAEGRVKRQPALRTLAAFFLLIGTLSLGALAMDVELLRAVAVAVVVSGVGLYPVVLLSFAARLVAIPGVLTRLGWALGAVTVLALDWSLATGGRAGLGLVFAILPFGMVGAHVVVGVAVVRHGRRLGSSYARRRSVTLNAGLLSLALAVVVSMMVPAERVGHLVSPSLALLSGVLLMVATAPPGWLQAFLLQPDLDQLEEVERSLIDAGDDDGAVEGFLAAMSHLVNGQSVWFERGDQVFGRRPHLQVPVASEAARGRGRLGQANVQPLAEDTWLLEADGRTGRLRIIAGADPVLYGLDRGPLLARLARRFELFVDARAASSERVARATLQAEVAHLQQMASLKDDVLATINHELRTPLVSVTGVLELILVRWDGMDDAQRLAMLERASSNAHDLQSLVFDVLALAGLRGGTATVAAVDVDLPGLIDDVVEELDGDGRVEVACAVPTARLDPAHARRVLRHLVGNALKHTDGAVGVVVEPGSEGSVRFEVADEGDGLDPALVALFARGGHHLTRTTRGLGLGLTLVAETLDLLGGSLRVRDRDGVGAVVVCRMPAGDRVIDLAHGLVQTG